MVESEAYHCYHPKGVASNYSDTIPCPHRSKHIIAYCHRMFHSICVLISVFRGPLNNSIHFSICFSFICVNTEIEGCVGGQDNLWKVSHRRLVHRATRKCRSQPVAGLTLICSRRGSTRARNISNSIDVKINCCVCSADKRRSKFSQEFVVELLDRLYSHSRYNN